MNGISIMSMWEVAPLHGAHHISPTAASVFVLSLSLTLSVQLQYGNNKYANAVKYSQSKIRKQ